MNSRFPRVKGKNQWFHRHTWRLSKTNQDDGQDWTTAKLLWRPADPQLDGFANAGSACVLHREKGELNQNKGEKFPSRVCAPTEPTLAPPLVQCCLGNSYLIGNGVHEMKMVRRWGALLIRSFLSDFSSICCQKSLFWGCTFFRIKMSLASWTHQLMKVVE